MKAMTHTSTEQPEALMKLADDYAEACFDQGFHQRITDEKPEDAREKLEKELRRLHARVQELEAQTAHMADLVELADYATKKLEASQAQRAPLIGLLSRIKKEIDHAVINDHHTTPAFGRLKGEPCVKVAHLEATIDGWHMEYGITQEKQE